MIKELETNSARLMMNSLKATTHLIDSLHV
jgi:hypothetical protein